MVKIYSLLLVILLLVSCTKEETDNIETVSALIDNSDWQAFTMSASLVYPVPSGNPCFTISATSKNNQELEIIVFYPKTGKYISNQGCSGQYLEYQGRFLEKEYFWTNSGEVNIIFDTINDLVSGTFKFVLRNDIDPADTLVITDGKFNNLRYINY